MLGGGDRISEGTAGVQPSARTEEEMVRRLERFRSWSLQVWGPWVALLAPILLCSPAAWSDDMMEFVGQYTPPLVEHWMDVDLNGTIAYVPGRAGLSLFDVGGPDPPQFLGRYVPPSGAQFYHAAPSSPNAFCAARHNGIWVVNVTDPSAPFLTHAHAEGTISFEGLLLDGADLYVAAHENGLRIYDVSVPTAFTLRSSVSALSNAWAVAKNGRWAYVADGDGGLRVIDCLDPDAPSLATTAPTSGPAQDVVLKGSRAFLACGAGGMDIFDISVPNAPAFMGNYASPYSSFLLAPDVAADRVYIASWDIVDVVEVSDPAQPVRVGFEDTPVRAMGVGAGADTVYVADWDSFRMYAFGPTTEPDIFPLPTTVSFPAIPIGQSADTTLLVSNTGGGTLTVTDITVTNPDFAAAPISFSVVADGLVEVTLTVTASTSKAVGKLRFLCDDPDEGNGMYTTDYGTVGSTAYDFTLQDLGGVWHSLSDFSEDVVLLYFFSAG